MGLYTAGKGGTGLYTARDGGTGLYTAGREVRGLYTAREGGTGLYTAGKARTGAVHGPGGRYGGCKQPGTWTFVYYTERQDLKPIDPNDDTLHVFTLVELINNKIG